MTQRWRLTTTIADFRMAKRETNKKIFDFDFDFDFDNHFEDVVVIVEIDKH